MKDYIVRKITKKSKNKYSYQYYNKRDTKINDKKYIQKSIEGLYIPPAYNNVKINIKKKRESKSDWL